MPCPYISPLGSNNPLINQIQTKIALAFFTSYAYHKAEDEKHLAQDAFYLHFREGTCIFGVRRWNERMYAINFTYEIAEENQRVFLERIKALEMFWKAQGFDFSIYRDITVFVNTHSENHLYRLSIEYARRYTA